MPEPSSTSARWLPLLEARLDGSEIPKSPELGPAIRRLAVLAAAVHRGGSDAVTVLDAPGSTPRTTKRSRLSPVHAAESFR
ncbi:MAG: hypothetical protein AAF916_04585 [Planctomycetota bacterium]